MMHIDTNVSFSRDVVLEQSYLFVVIHANNSQIDHMIDNLTL